MRLRIILPVLVFACTVVFSSSLGLTQNATVPKDSASVAPKNNGASTIAGAGIAPKDNSANVASQDASPASGDTIPPGTAITMANWQNFKQFMPDGMVALFEGTYSWKMPADVRMEVGPTVLHPLPKNYLDATEKYSNQVK